jgi:hypothetical protein
MIDHLYIQRLKILAMISTTALLAVAAFDSVTRGGTYQTRERRDFEIVPMNSTLDRRLGGNDNPEFVVQFSGDTHGNLGPCG